MFQFLSMVFRICMIIFGFVNFELCFCQRRITHGQYSPNGKNFMVYLLNSRYSDVQPESWLCGGALISETRILTSAACLTEVSYIYAIAGYKKYVSGENIENDECTRTRKQKVVQFIIPTGFKKHGSVNADIWMRVDVGVAVVEKPYDFTDRSYRLVCSYEPNKIAINFDRKYEEPNTVAVVYGWGGTKARKPDEKGDINSMYLREARTVITNTTFCANYVDKGLKPIVMKSLICAFGSGYVNSNKKDKNPGDGDNCKWRRFNLNESEFVGCREDEEFLFRSRNGQNIDSQKVIPETRRDNDEKDDAGGICENDHGGPLVTWIGKSEVIIGIALTSIYNIKYECQGPFLYVGTARSGALIQCLLAETNETRALCQTLENNVQTVRIHWPETEKTEEHTEKQSYKEERAKPSDTSVRRHQMPITQVTKQTYQRYQPLHQYAVKQPADYYYRESRARIRPQREISREIFG